MNTEKLKPGGKAHLRHHNHLLNIVKKLEKDYEPWGMMTDEDRKERWVDCSAGCAYYYVLEGPLGMDWGVCTNPKSHRVGLLTFEHQGCMHFALKQDHAKQNPDEG